jgi:hypothetical protein
MSLVDRLRSRLPHAPAGLAWDDGDAGDLPVRVARMAAALDPDPGDPRLTTSRAAVLGAFAATADPANALQGAPGRALPPAGAAPEIRRGGRRPALILVAAGMLLAMSLGAVAASAPGGPLYDVRVAAEGALLPPAPDDRTTAQVERLEARLAEATGAAERGDTVGVNAALRAYARIANAAVGGPATDVARRTRLAAQVRAQLDVITRIGTGDPALGAGREQARVAARALLGVLGEPGDGAEPEVGPHASRSPGPSLVVSASPRSPSSTGTPDRTDSPRASSGSGASASPVGPQGSPAPGTTAEPRTPPTPGATASPKPSSSPTPSSSLSPSPAPMPRATTDPSPAPGGGSGPGTPGAGGATPGPGGGQP